MGNYLIGSKTVHTAVCHKCSRTLPFTREYFPVHDGCKGGLEAVCKKCKANATRAWGERYRKENGEATFDGAKICYKCRKEKPKSDFDLDSRSKDGLRHHCKQCVKLEQRELSRKRTEIRADVLFDGKKRCSRCNRTKPKVDFGVHRRSPDGLRDTCKECRKNMRRIERHGIDNDRFEKICVSQDHKCEICGCPIDENACVDHDHETGKIRGVICWSCNIGLGHFKDDPVMMINAANYINKYKTINDDDMKKPIDRIILADSANLEEYVDDDTVSLVVCSPPYNVGIEEYETKMKTRDYLDMLDRTWKECWRVLRIGGRLVVNVADTCRRPYIPLHCHITERLLKQHWFMRGIINWDKGNSCALSTAWGSWKSCSNPYLNDQVEYILVFSKTNACLTSVNGKKPDITRDEFLLFRQNSWKMETESATAIGHPAPFPEDLPYRAIKLYSYPEDLIVDPFSGSGTTCVVAKKTGRHYLGFDIKQEYVELAQDRLASVHAKGKAW